MEPYNAEFRGEVLAACDTKEERRAIAVRFKVSGYWLRRIQQQRRETGQVVPKKAAPRQPGGMPGLSGLSPRSRRGRHLSA